MPSTASKEQGILAYVLKGYPRLSETFILNEMLRLEELGFRLHIYALRDPGEAVVHAGVSRVAARVDYVPDDFWRSGVALVAANLALFWDRPRRYWRGFREATWRSLARRSSSTLKRFAQAAYLVQRHLRAEPAAHLHAHFAHGPATVALYAAALSGTPWSFTAHAKDLYVQEEDFLRSKLERARFAVTCTGFNRARLAAVWGGTPIHRIYHGVDLEAFAPPPGRADPATPLILSVGRLVPKKGFPVLVEALRLLAGRGLRFRCEIAGSGPQKRELHSRIEAAGLADRVHLLGQRSQEELLEHYRSAACMALACEVQADGDRDGIPNVLVEAAAVGVPLVSTRISGIPELVEHGVSGLLVEPSDPRGLAEALAQLLSDRALAGRLARAARERVRQDFDLRSNTRRLGEIFRAALEGATLPAEAAGAAHPEPRRALAAAEESR